MKKILIVEDESFAADHLERLVQETDPSIRVVAKLESIADTVEWLSKNQPDLILMDIQLEDGLSFEIFERVRTEAPVIFVTAYDEYAIRAFKYNSLDYLLKPVKPEELRQALDKHSRQLKQAVPFDPQALSNFLHHFQPEYRERFSVQLGNRLYSINTEEIAYIFYEDKMANIVLETGKSFPYYASLDLLMAQLNPKKFFRINRGCIMHSRSVDKIEIYPNRHLVVKLKPGNIPLQTVSRERTTDFKKWLDY